MSTSPRELVPRMQHQAMPGLSRPCPELRQETSSVCRSSLGRGSASAPCAQACQLAMRQEEEERGTADLPDDEAFRGGSAGGEEGRGELLLLRPLLQPHLLHPAPPVQHWGGGEAERASEGAQVVPGEERRGGRVETKSCDDKDRGREVAVVDAVHGLHVLEEERGVGRERAFRSHRRCNLLCSAEPGERGLVCVRPRIHFPLKEAAVPPVQLLGDHHLSPVQHHPFGSSHDVVPSNSGRKREVWGPRERWRCCKACCCRFILVCWSAGRADLPSADGDALVALGCS
mmetsp:Transcript_42834/g.101134  ORF Transcript_42834/g.101134 Transcript_42834/m.101134 type:complete len:287 (+) Transcript_42834:198-1058(+)